MNDEYPMGHPYLALEKLNHVYKLKDVTSKIIMKTEVEAVTFKQADDYPTDVNHIMSKYNHKLNDTELLEIMMGKTGNTTFIKEIKDKLKKVNPSFESCCIEIAALQRLAKVKTGPVQQPKQKEVSLSNQGTSGGGSGGS
jgi:acetolactate synthase small subunit